MGIDQFQAILIRPMITSVQQVVKACVCFGMLTVWPSGLLLAQTNNSYPMLMNLRPAAAAVGASTEHELSARYNLAGASTIWVSGEGVRAEIVPSDAEKPEDKDRNDVMSSKCKLRFVCEPNAVPGVRDFRVMTPHGASTVGQVVIAREVIVSESQDNDTPETAQGIHLPVTICGAIEKGEDLDYYRFHVDQPIDLCLHMVSQRLQNRLHDMQTRVDPMLTLKNEIGATIATSDNVVAGDPLLHQRIEVAGDYLIEVRDVRYQGNADWVYSIECSTRPFVTVIRPLAYAPGTTALATMEGLGLPANTQTTLSIPSQPLEGMVRLAPELAGVPLNGVSIAVTSDPIQLEQILLAATGTPATDGTTLSAASESIPSIPFVVPAMLCGTLDSTGQSDRFSFEAKAGDAVTFEVLARRLGSSLDAKLRILNATGSGLAEADDMTFERVLSSDAMLENWVAPADGTYTVEVRDLHGRGGPDFPYALHVTRARPYFLLEVDTDKTMLAPGTASVVYVKALRRNGFAGDIQLAIEGVPQGVSATVGEILSSGNDGAIWLTAAADAPMSMANVTITGKSIVKAADGNQEALVGRANCMQEVYLPGGGRGHYPVQVHTVSVAKPMDIRNVNISTGDVQLKPGQSQRIEITVERAPDYKGNVTLDIMLQHLEQPYGNPLPKGVSVDQGASKTLLSSSENTGYITLKAAPDAPPVQHHLVPITVHVPINFVMKHTFSGQPLFITVSPP